MKHYLVALIIGTLVASSLTAEAGLGRNDTEEYACNVLVGGGLGTPAGNLGLGLDPVADANVGGCELVDALPDTGTVLKMAMADGCAAFADVDADSPGAEMPVESGMPVKKGTALWVYCDAGVVDATSILTVDFR